MCMSSTMPSRMPPHPLNMVDAAGWRMKAPLLAMLALVIIFFHNRFG